MNRPALRALDLALSDLVIARARYVDFLARHPDHKDAARARLRISVYDSEIAKLEGELNGHGEL